MTKQKQETISPTITANIFSLLLGFYLFYKHLPLFYFCWCWGQEPSLSFLSSSFPELELQAWNSVLTVCSSAPDPGLSGQGRHSTSPCWASLLCCHSDSCLPLPLVPSTNFPSSHLQTSCCFDLLCHLSTYLFGILSPVMFRRSL